MITLNIYNQKNILDQISCIVTGYDGIIKPTQGIFNLFNDKYKIEQ